MNSIEYIGFLAGILVSLSVLPQIVKSWQTKSTKDISIYWNLINLLGQIMWMFYGLGISSMSLVIMSAISFLMNLSMVILKLKFG